MKQASLDPALPSDRAKCVFVDDSLPNVRGAKKFGFKSSVWFREVLSQEQRAHLVSGNEEKIEAILKAPTGAYAEQLKQSLEVGDGKETEGVDAVVADLQELRDAWSFVFKEKDESSTS
jgi:pyrimidine and pyridine-specific 5'-nucleotidase